MPGDSLDHQPSHGWGWHHPPLGSWQLSLGLRSAHPEQHLDSLRLPSLLSEQAAGAPSSHQLPTTSQSSPVPGWVLPITPALLTHPPSYHPASFHQTPSEVQSDSSLHSCWLLKEAAAATDANRDVSIPGWLQPCPGCLRRATPRAPAMHQGLAGLVTLTWHLFKVWAQNYLGLCHLSSRVPPSQDMQPPWSRAAESL